MKNPEKTKPIDSFLLIITGLLVVSGSAFFISASLGLLARDAGPSVSQLAVKQLLVGLALGGLILYVFSRITLSFWRRSGFFIYLASLVLSLFVFIPGLGFSFGGARRWIHVFGISFQPAELLKFGIILYYAALLAAMGKNVKTWKGGFLATLLVLVPPVGILSLHPDLGTTAIIVSAIFAMYIGGGARVVHVLSMIGLFAVLFAGIIATKPYALDRVMTFLHQGDREGSSYQVTQSLTAIGAGGLWGRGFGQSIQKFRYLPEPMGDSIFAVIGEEFGLVGTVGLIILFLLFLGRSFSIAGKTSDRFGGLVVVGIAILIVTQSFFNMASMLQLVPLSGMPLIFVSQGGTALVTALASVGVILAVSRTVHVEKKSQLS